MKRPSLHLSSDRGYLCFALALYILLWVIYPHRFVASDPWEYSHNAWLITQGGFFQGPDDHPFAHRLGVTLPVSLFYKLFGVSLITTNLWSLFAALLLAITVWSALPTGRSRRVGLALCLTSVPMLKGATVLNPDLIVAAFLGFSSLLLHRRRGALEKSLRHRLIPVIAVAAFFIAFLAKLSAYWALPLWLWTFTSDVRQREWRLLARFYLPACVTFLAFGAVYLMFCDHVWGEPLSRLQGVEKLTGHHLWSWTNVLFSEQMERLTIVPFFLYGGYYGMTFVFALLAFPLLPKRLRFWGGYTLCMTALYWFGSTSLSTYQPLPAAGRMTLPVFSGLYILAGWFVAYKGVDIPRLSFRTSRQLTCATLLCAAALPILPYLWGLPWEPSSEERAAEIVRREVASQPDRRFLLVCADVRSPESLAFYFDYRYPPNLHPVSIDGIEAAELTRTHHVFLFLHEERSRFLMEAYGYENQGKCIKHCRSAGMTPCFEDDGIHLWNIDGRIAGDLFKGGSIVDIENLK